MFGKVQNTPLNSGYIAFLSFFPSRKGKEYENIKFQSIQ